MAGGGVDSSWLRHFRSAFENLFSALVDSENTDDKVAIPHSSVFDLDFKLIPRENHSDKIDIIAVDTNEFAIDYQKNSSLRHANRNAFTYDSLHMPSSSGTRKHAMRNATRQGGKCGNGGVRANGVEVLGDL